MTQAGRPSGTQSAPHPGPGPGVQPRTFGMARAGAAHRAAHGHASGAPYGQPSGAPYGAAPQGSLSGQGAPGSEAPWAQAGYGAPGAMPASAYSAAGGSAYGGAGDAPYGGAPCSMPYSIPYGARPDGGQVASERPGKKRHRARWAIAILLSLCIAAALLFLLLDCKGPSKRAGISGSLAGKTPEEIQSELDRIVDDGMFSISIASTVQMASGTSPAELRIENVPGNRYLMRVVITRDDTKEQLYETDLIEPNFHIQKDTLDVALDAGVHTCLAVFTAYDPETEEEIGQAAARMSIQVAS